MKAHTTQYTHHGQPRGGARVEWGWFLQKLGPAARVWWELRKVAENDLVRMPRSGMARRTGLTVNQVERALIKLRQTGLIEDIGTEWGFVKTADGRPAEGWRYIRQVRGAASQRSTDCVEFPYICVISRASEKAVSKLGRGGARKGAGRKPKSPDQRVISKRPKPPRSTPIDRKEPFSKRGTPISKRGTPPPESLRNPNQSVAPVNTKLTNTVEVIGRVSSFGEHAAENGAQLLPPSEVPWPYEVSKSLPAFPRPLSMAKLGINDRSAAHHMLRLYSSYREVRYGTRFWWRGSAEKQKWWVRLMNAVAEMRRRDIHPGYWIAWADAVLWQRDDSGSKKGPPPINVVFSTKAMEKHEAWFRGTYQDYGQYDRAAPIPPTAKKLLSLYFDSRKPRATAKVSAADWNSLFDAALLECRDVKEELHERARGAEWLW